MPVRHHRNPQQTDLFGTIHELVRAKGARNAVAYAQSIAALDQPQEGGLAPFVRALAGRNGRRFADAASATMLRDFEEVERQIGYSYSAWCLAGLPHRDHPPGQDWLIETDYAQLLIVPRSVV